MKSYADPRSIFALMQIKLHFYKYSCNNANMNWDDLKYFLAIATAGNLYEAAQQLGVNHSTVFRRLESFEAQLDLELFDRNSKPYSLTADGERLLIIAREAEAALLKIDSQILGVRATPAGSVKVSAPANIASNVMPIVMRSLRVEFPDISIDLSISDSYSALEQRKVDIAFAAVSSPPEHLYGSYLVTLGWWLYGDKSAHKAYKKNPKSVNLIAPSTGLANNEVSKWISEQNNEVVAYCDSYAVIAKMVKLGIGCAVLPEDQTFEELTAIVRIPAVYGQLWLLAYSEIQKQPHVLVVWDAIIAAMAEEYG